MNSSPPRSSRRRFDRRFPINRVAIAILLVALPLALAACTPAPALIRHTVVLPASDLVTRDQWEYYRYCTSSCFSSYREHSAPPGRLLVGADNFFEPGSGPFPSIVKLDYAYRGAVRFNLAEFRNLKQVVVERASINWTIDSALVRTGNGDPSGVASGPDVTNCVGALMEGKQSPFTEGAFLPAYPYRSGKGDVTDLVQDWVMNGVTNWGFVLVGLDESYSRNNAACLNAISNITLTLTYLIPA